MENNSEITFNNQVFNNPSTTQPVIWGQGAHQKLLDLIQEENEESISEFLNSVPNPELLINAIDTTFKQSAFYKAVNIQNDQKCLSIAKLLFSKGGKLNVKDIHGQSPLFYICKEGKLELLTMCLNQGVDVNETDHFRQTPLFYASRDGKTDCVKLMIANKANPNHKDKVDQTAMFYASRDNRFEVVKVLVKGGGDVNISDHKKQTALYFARKNGNKEIDEFLVANGAVNTKDGILKQADLKKVAKPGFLISRQNQINKPSFRNEFTKRQKISRDNKKKERSNSR